MQLIEREGCLALLRSAFEATSYGEGHCVLVTGEAGIGKTSLVRAFCQEVKNDCKILQGTCDALFTPRPLAPLYDIAWQMQTDIMQRVTGKTDRTALFTGLLQKLSAQKEPVVLVFEDIHWADEATLDFIKFLARRITHIHCLFILTFRDNEIHSAHALRNVLGQLPFDAFSRLQLIPLSRDAVEKMAVEKGYSGEDVYSISGGNPFYVNEILASYSPGVPDNIKDSVLSIFRRHDEKTRRVWEILSVLPTGIETKYLEKMVPLYAESIGYCLSSKILIIDKGLIFFKHELYRRTIESALSPFVRIALNKNILDLFRESFEGSGEIERIIHHAKNANEYELVSCYAPLAAAHAVALGSHIEAAKLYYTAIEYYQGSDKDKLIELYELYAYECYLTNKHKDAIIYTQKSLNLWTEKNELEKMGNCMRFLSRLWWFDGKRKQAESFADQAIKVLDKQPSSKAKAMAYSNMSQLKSSEEQTKECIFWGEKAAAIAREIDDRETLAHALISMGSALIMNPSSMQNGIELFQQSLEIALENSYHEHGARIYMTLGANLVSLKEYEQAKKALDTGILYCEERGIDSHKLYMLSWRARLNLETGNWQDAYAIASDLLKNEDLLPVVKMGTLNVLATIKMRRCDQDAIVLLLEAKALAFETTELQRIIPAFLALLEYEWLTGQTCFEIEALSGAIKTMIELEKFSKKSRFYFWLWKTGKDHLLPEKNYEDYEENSLTTAMKQAALWEKWGCPYEQALALFEGNDADKKRALTMVQALGAGAVYEKMKLEMRSSGIKSIPRGVRKSTRSNAAHLTDRELDVLRLLKEGLQNKEIADKLFISAKTVDHHISSILLKLGVNSRMKAVQEAISMDIIK
jgi:DNA-binding CsgD family transcriptional regulator